MFVCRLSIDDFFTSPKMFVDQMRNLVVLVLLVVVVELSCLVPVLDASAGDAQPTYRACVQQCEKRGYIGERSFTHCRFSSDNISKDVPWYIRDLYSSWKHSECVSDCRYHCMIDREKERELFGYEPIKYHGKWPFKRVFGVQEPVSVAFSILNLAMHVQGWLSFRLNLKKDKKPYYEYSTLWHIYGLLSINSWFWSAVFHYRDVDLTEKLDYSSAVALLGGSLIVAITRCFSVRTEAARVMAAAPLLAFITTHILYLNIYKLDYGWNMSVCVVMAVAQLLLWAVWAGVTRHPSRWKVWTVVFVGGLAMLLEIFDFPPYNGFLDAHALWHFFTVPLTCVWWSFISDDVRFRTATFQKKAK